MNRDILSYKYSSSSNLPQSFENFLKFENIQDLTEKLCEKRVSNITKQFEHEDQVIMKMKFSMSRPTVMDRHNTADLWKYISMLESMLNARTLLHYNCRKIVRVLMHNYNNTRSDLSYLLKQIINNEI